MLFSQPWETAKVNRLRDKKPCKSMKTFQELQVCPVPHCRDPNKLLWLLVCLKHGLSELVPTWSLQHRHTCPQGHATKRPLALCCLKACKAIPCQHVISSPLNRWTWPGSGLKMSNFQANPWKALLHSFPNVSTYAFPIWMATAVFPQAPNTSPQFPISLFHSPISSFQVFPGLAPSDATPTYRRHLLPSCLLAAILSCFFHNWWSQPLG